MSTEAKCHIFCEMVIIILQIIFHDPSVGVKKHIEETPIILKQLLEFFEWHNNRLSLVILTRRLIIRSTLHLRSDDNDPFITDT